MNTETPSMRDALLPRICRLTTLDRVAMTFAAIFLFGVVAVAALAYLTIGDAPQGRMWGFIAIYAVIGFAFGIVAPWLLYRTLHAAGHAAQISRTRRVARTRQTEPLIAFFQGRVA